MIGERSDVLIMGGGLAGLTLAIQLRRELPTLTVRVLERNRHPVPEAAFKIGESSVEIGAHYLETVLDLRAHLETRQLRKFGFRFFFNEGRDALDECVELGPSSVFPTPSYQLDRGILENFLGQHAAALGVEFVDGAVVRHVDLAETDQQAATAQASAGDHVIHFERADTMHTAAARWVVDASGAAGLLKRKLGLEESNDHDANSVWFRVADRVAIDDWHEGDWKQRCDPPERWRSTNHLCGPGYWTWLIPLSSGSHSVGIVADARMHPLATINTFDKAMAWLAEHQPQLHRELEPRRHLLQDFAYLRHFSHGCRQVFSAKRWAITGIAGVFLDPFYSPGTDYIAIANTYIADLIGRDSRSEPFARQARAYEQLFFSFYRNMLPLYEGQYPMFGHAQWMPIKVVWDYAYYWGILCQFFFQKRLTDVALFVRLAEPLATCAALNRDVQLLLRRAAGSGVGAISPAFVDQNELKWFGEMNRGLRDVLDEAALQRRIEENAATLRELAAQIAERVRAEHPAAFEGLDSLVGLAAKLEPDLLRAA
jgi:flavin-dependent dehydrogenase